MLLADLYSSANLSSLVGLTELRLDNNRITKIEGLGELRNLIWLGALWNKLCVWLYASVEVTALTAVSQCVLLYVCVCAMCVSGVCIVLLVCARVRVYASVVWTTHDAQACWPSSVALITGSVLLSEQTYSLLVVLFYHS